MTSLGDTERDELASVLAASQRLPPQVAVEVSSAYDVLCDPRDPPPPPLHAVEVDSAQVIRAVRRQLVEAIAAAADVNDAITLGTAARHLTSALGLLDGRAAVQ